MANDKKVLVYVILLSVLFDNLLIDFLKFPSAVRYINDVLLLVLVFSCVRQGIQHRKYSEYIKKIQESLHQNGCMKTIRMAYQQYGLVSVIIAIVLFTILFLPGWIINGGSPLLILWAGRNLYRFFAFYFVCVCILKKEDVVHILDLFCKIHYLNLALCLVECFGFGKTRDYLGGIFGISKGCNGYLNIYLCILLIYVIYKYLNELASTKYMMFFLCSMMLIAGLAELKIFFIEMVLIIGFIWMLNRSSERMKIIMKAGIGVIAVGLLALFFVAPQHFRVLTSLGRLFEYGNSERGGYNLSRFHAFSNINQLFFGGSCLLNLFGLGFGNCEYSSFAFLQSSFYQEFGQYNYRWFMHQMLFLETGYAGILSFAGIFVAIAYQAWKNRKEQKKEFFHEMTLIMCLLTIINIWYDASLRSECAYMIWFVLAISAIVKKAHSEKILSKKEASGELSRKYMTKERMIKMQIEQPIDFVIAWVDGNDREWQKEKNRYLHPDEDESQFDASNVRYRDWENLKYWFRAVEKYAPWVNKIHFVTCGHKPEWLNTEAPKLHLVKHSDYIPEEYLPTFSSHPIELNLHRIPGLSEQFVYFNDDFFLNAPVKPEDFFVNGLPCDSLEEKPMTFPAHLLTNSVFVNDLIFANEHFQRKKCRKELWRKWYCLRDPHVLVKNLILALFNDETFLGLNIHHLPQAYLKQTLQEVWELEPELLSETCSHRFRDERDVSQCVFKFWQLLNGRFYNYNKRKNGRSLLVSTKTPEICQVIRNHQYKFLCINDSENVDFEKTKQLINGAFESVLPEKSVYEK